MTTIRDEVTELLARGETEISDEELRLLMCGRVVDDYPGRILARLLAAGISEYDRGVQGVALKREGNVITARVVDGMAVGDSI